MFGSLLIGTVAFFGILFLFRLFLPLALLASVAAAALIGAANRGTRSALPTAFLMGWLGFSAGSLGAFFGALALDPTRYPTSGPSDVLPSAFGLLLVGVLIGLLTGFLAEGASRVFLRFLGAPTMPLARTAQGRAEGGESMAEEAAEVGEAEGFVDTRPFLRSAGTLFKISAACWLAHCTIVAGVGVFVLIAELGTDVGSTIFFGFLLGVVASSVGALLLGVTIVDLSRATAHRVSRAAASAGRLGGTLLLGYAALGFAAMSLPFVLPITFSPFAYTYILLDLWLFASLALAASAIGGGRFLAEYLPLEGIWTDPLALVLEFAGLTVVSAIELIRSLMFSSRWLLLTLAVLPFGITPALGVGAFTRLYRLGQRMVAR